MILIRPVRPDDLDPLYDLAHLGNFLNLPQDKELLQQLIHKAVDSFYSSKHRSSESNRFLFVAEDKQQKILGCSAIKAQHGTPEKPHVYFEIKKDTQTSGDLGPFHWQYLLFGANTTGFSEIGGLVVNPSARGWRLGKALSFARFLFIEQHPEVFKNEIHCEIMPPVHPLEGNALWREIGQRFTGLNYEQADERSRTDTQFICDLFPKTGIYTHYLSEEARAMIGAISKNARPVVTLLEELGFSDTAHIDPFDGGPHFRLPKKNIHLNKKMLTLKRSLGDIDAPEKTFMLKPTRSEDAPFFCLVACGKLCLESKTFYVHESRKELELAETWSALILSQ